MSFVQTYLGPEHYKLRMALTKFSADLLVSFNLSAGFQCQGNVALQKRNLGAHSCRVGKVVSLTETVKIHLYSKKLVNVGQIFTYSKVSFQFHRGKIVCYSGFMMQQSMHCLSLQLAVKFYLKWNHSQVFALPSPMGNHKINPCLQQECPSGPSGNSKRVSACRGGQTDPEFVFSISPSCANAAFGRRGSLAPC